MNNPEFSVTIFAIGCMGALAPEIVRLYNLRNNPGFAWSWFYLVISGCFALLGGLIAWILPTTTYYGAFYAGVTTPVIVTTILRDRKSTPRKRITREELRDELRMVVKEMFEASNGPQEAQDTEIGRVAVKRNTGGEPPLGEIIDRILDKGTVDKGTVDKGTVDKGTVIDVFGRLMGGGIEALAKEMRKSKLSHLLYDYFQAL